MKTPGGCVPTLDAEGKVVGWHCYGDLEARHWELLAEQSEQDWEDYQAEMAQEANMTLREREPDFWEYREATDPFWPPAECDTYEVQEPEVIG